MLNRQLQRWEDHGSCIEVTTHGMTVTRRGFEAERMRETDDLPSQDESRPVMDQSMSNATATGDSLLNLAEDSVSGSPSADTDSPLARRNLLDESNPVTDNSPSNQAQSDFTTSQRDVSGKVTNREEAAEINNRFARISKEAGGYQTESTHVDEQPGEEDEEDEEIIFNLVVSVKAPQTVNAIRRVAHRLTQDSTILFLQNGMGIIDEVNEKLFPEVEYRPTYIVGVVSHGIYANGSFSIVHAGEGTIALGVMPRMPMDENTKPDFLSQLATSARYIIRTMTRTPVFIAVGCPPTALLQQQLDKLAVNCIINPLTAILDCKNGALLANMYFTRVIRLLLAEISIVIRSLPELKNVPNVNMRFDTVRLERLVFSIANTTAGNHSSMLQDVRAGKQTEIDYINGYIVRRGEERGIHCVMNYMLMHLVKGKNKTKSLEQADLLPLTGPHRGR